MPSQLRRACVHRDAQDLDTRLRPASVMCSLRKSSNRTSRVRYFSCDPPTPVEPRAGFNEPKVSDGYPLQRPLWIDLILMYHLHKAQANPKSVRNHVA